MATKRAFKGRLAGKIVVIHGKFGYGEEGMLKELVCAHGATIAEDLSEKVDFLALADLTANQTLQKKALSLNGKGATIQVIAADALRKMCDVTEEEVRSIILAGGTENGKLLGQLLQDQHHFGWNQKRPAARFRLAGEIFRGCNLAEFRFPQIAFDGCDFSEANLEAAVIEESPRCDFSGARAKNATFDDVQGSKFLNAQLDFAGLKPTLENVDFTNASLACSHFNDYRYGVGGKGAAIRNVTFRGAVMRKAKFGPVTLKHCSFENADLTGAEFHGATFEAVSFRSANLRSAILVGCKLPGADFGGADLTGANFAEADLTGACFDGADLSNCNLRGATMDKAAMSKAKNYNPNATVGGVGPALKELDSLATKAKRIRFSFRVVIDSDPEGTEASIDTNGLKYGWGVHIPGGLAMHPNRTRKQNQTISDAMLEMASLVGGYKVRFETVDAETTKSPKAAKEICDLVIQGISEAFGIAPPPAEELAAATKAYREKQRETGAAQRQEYEKRKAAAEKAKAAEVKKIEKKIEKQVGKVTDIGTFLKALGLRIEEAKIDKATKMLKKEGFQLFNDVTDTFMSGVVKSQTDPDLVYACRIAHDGKYACCTQNLNICGGLRGSICKHLLVLIIGLVKAEKLDPTTIDGWVAKSNQQKAELDKEVMGEIFIKYKGAEAGEIDWRPTETLPEDYYAV